MFKEFLQSILKDNSTLSSWRRPLGLHKPKVRAGQCEERPALKRPRPDAVHGHGSREAAALTQGQERGSARQGSKGQLGGPQTFGDLTPSACWGWSPSSREDLKGWELKPRIFCWLLYLCKETASLGTLGYFLRKKHVEHQELGGILLFICI